MHSSDCFLRGRLSSKGNAAMESAVSPKAMPTIRGLPDSRDVKIDKNHGEPYGHLAEAPLYHRRKELLKLGALSPSGMTGGPFFPHEQISTQKTRSTISAASRRPIIPSRVVSAPVAHIREMYLPGPSGFQENCSPPAHDTRPRRCASKIPASR